MKKKEKIIFVDLFNKESYTLEDILKIKKEREENEKNKLKKK